MHSNTLLQCQRSDLRHWVENAVGEVSGARNQSHSIRSDGASHRSDIGNKSALVHRHRDELQTKVLTALVEGRVSSRRGDTEKGKQTQKRSEKSKSRFTSQAL